MRAWFLLAILALPMAGLTGHAVGKDGLPPALGMYIHQHWAYNHPYASRTWTLDDWHGYLDGLSRLGYNMVLIWPMLETMPEPLTASDEENLRKIAAVIKLAHTKFSMRVNLVLCPNVSAKNEVARQYPFEKRPFFTTDDRVDPADPVALGRLVAWRERLLAPLAEADGVFVIDSDPGGFPHSTNLDFVYLLKTHRRMLDRLRPGIELVYWTHFGWEAYGRFYATGELKRGEQSEPREAMQMLAREQVEPWSVASSGFPPDLADPIGMGDRVLGFPYGMIEREPSFPFTNFSYDRAYEAGQRKGARGVMGNAQTHVVQLPHTFAFAQGAKGLPLERRDLVDFADQLIAGGGASIVSAWEVLQGDDAGQMDRAAAGLTALKKAGLRAGSLQGLLLGGAERFVDDLILQLDANAALVRFASAIKANGADGQDIMETFSRFVDAISAWQARHGYRGNWRWPRMYEALERLDKAQINEVVATLVIVSKVGATPFDRVKNGLADLESYTHRLIRAMQDARDEMRSRQRQSRN